MTVLGHATGCQCFIEQLNHFDARQGLPVWALLWGGGTSLSRYPSLPPHRGTSTENRCAGCHQLPIAPASRIDMDMRNDVFDYFHGKATIAGVGTHPFHDSGRWLVNISENESGERG